MGCKPSCLTNGRFPFLDKVATGCAISREFGGEFVVFSCICHASCVDSLMALF